MRYGSLAGTWSGSGEPAAPAMKSSGSGEPAATPRQPLLPSQARCALLPAATPRLTFVHSSTPDAPGPSDGQSSGPSGDQKRAADGLWERVWPRVVGVIECTKV